MDYVELIGRIQELVSEIASTSDDAELDIVSHYADHGEPEEAVDLLIAILVKTGLPITSLQRSRLREVTEHLEGGPKREVDYMYLGDPEMLDRMTVVDRPS